MVDIYTARTEFKNEVSHRRRENHWTHRELAERARMSPSLVAAFEGGDKAVSSQSALKLADAFQLKGSLREHFLLLAAQTRRKDKLVPYARELHAEILNFVPRMLKEAGIDLNTIRDCQYTFEEQKDGRAGIDRLEIVLESGSNYK